MLVGRAPWEDLQRRSSVQPKAKITLRSLSSMRIILRTSSAHFWCAKHVHCALHGIYVEIIAEGEDIPNTATSQKEPKLH